MRGRFAPDGAGGGSTRTHWRSLTIVARPLAPRSDVVRTEPGRSDLRYVIRWLCDDGSSSRRHRRDSLQRGPKRRRRAAPVERVLEEPELLDDALVGRRDVAVGPLAVVAPGLSRIFLADL